MQDHRKEVTSLIHITQKLGQHLKQTKVTTGARTDHKKIQLPKGNSLAGGGHRQLLSLYPTM